MNSNLVTIVSGLPRSGTSLMMRMLQAGGMEVLTDEVRAADADNPRGYYEWERVKKLKEDPDCLKEAQGKVVKIISQLLLHVPRRYPCKVIFMRRAMTEILASQRQMLLRRDKPTDAVSDEDMAALFDKHLRQVERWIAQQPHLEVLYISYNELLQQPAGYIERINRFLGGHLAIERMAQAVDPDLYRQRGT